MRWLPSLWIVWLQFAPITSSNRWPALKGSVETNIRKRWTKAVQSIEASTTLKWMDSLRPISQINPNFNKTGLNENQKQHLLISDLAAVEWNALEHLLKSEVKCEGLTRKPGMIPIAFVNSCSTDLVSKPTARWTTRSLQSCPRFHPPLYDYCVWYDCCMTTSHLNLRIRRINLKELEMDWGRWSSTHLCRPSGKVRTSISLKILT